MSETKRQQIKDKVSKGEARLRERAASFPEKAAEIRDDAVDFARQHPLLVIGGGLALGVVISAMFSRSPTRKAAKKGAKKASAMALLAAEFALPLIQQAMASASEAGRAGADRLEEFGEAAGERARSIGREAAGRAGDTVGATRQAGRRIAKAVRSRTH